MSSSDSATVAQVIATYQDSTTIDTVGNVVTALLLYDVLLTSGQEYRYIWRSPKSWVSRGLYVWNRYMFLLCLLLELGTASSISDTSCAWLIWLGNILGYLNLIAPAMFTTLRIYALSRQNRILSGVALVLSMTPFVINISICFQRLPINLPAPLNCSQADPASRSLDIGIAARGSLILVDSLAVVVTWCQTRAAVQLRTNTVKRPSLEQVIWENGSVYFCVLVSMNMVNMVLVILSISLPPLDDHSSYIMFFIDPISSILNSRFLLALHETNARLEGAADTSISSPSLNTGSGDDSRAGPHELPGYLGVIGGSIRSFHDEDEDLQSLEFAPPQEEEPQPQPEGEIPGSGGDGGHLA